MGGVRLDSRDVGAVLDAAWDCDGLASQDEVPHLLDALARLVRCDVLFWNWYRKPPDLMEFARLDAASTRPVTCAPLDGWLEYLPEHPIMSGRWGPVVAVSDVLRTKRELERTWLGELARSDGFWFEIGLELTHPTDEMSVIALSRISGRDFDDRDHMVLRLLRPHVDAAIRRATRPPPALTPREHEVMRLVRDGLTDAQVARRLGVAEATVSKHLEHVYAKSGARSRVEAVAICVPALEAEGPTVIAGAARAPSPSPQPARR